MQIYKLQLDAAQILAEQLKLLLGHVLTTLFPTFLISILLVWALTNNSNAVLLIGWAVALNVFKVISVVHAKIALAENYFSSQPRRLVFFLLFLNIVEGMIWGSLAWITLSASTFITGNILVIAALAGVAGYSVSRLAPVLPVYIAFSAAMLLTVALKVWLAVDFNYDALGWASILYLLILFLLARFNARDARSAIQEKLENSALLQQLKNKAIIAESSQREAEKANTAKSKFFAAASHDLRQPIHAQGLFLEVLSRTEQTQQQKALVASARAASEASSELLNALLDFSRIEAGVVVPQLQPFRLQPLLNKIESELAPQADTKNIVYRSRETQIVVFTDPMLLELILRNLVTNAIRYTHHGGLLVACRQHGAQAVLEVWDTGIGIAPEHQKEVFREFHQLGNPERDPNKGLGLGLAIADGLARTMGHELKFSSVPERGSVFRLSMPVDNSLPAFELNMAQSKTRVLNARLLVIDDDETVREGMLHLLRDWGCVCEATENIEEALHIVNLNRPDFVISDYRLREQRTGVEAIAAIRALLGEPIPALLITGDTAPERLSEAKASGIPLLHKPVSPSKLYRKLIELHQEFIKTHT